LQFGAEVFGFFKERRWVSKRMSTCRRIHQRLVLTILRAHLPHSVKAWALGPRAVTFE
jgi:hypothetical protein